MVYVRRQRLGDLAAIVASFNGRTTVQAQRLNEFEMYVTVMIPYGKTREFRENLYEEGIRMV